MARARNIKPGFFSNDTLAELDPLTRLLFIGLWCIADRAGRLEDRPKKIKAEVLPYDECDIDEMLTNLHNRCFVIRYTESGLKLIQVINFEKHQAPHKNEKESELPEYSGASTVQAPECSGKSTVALALIEDRGLMIDDSGLMNEESPAPPESHPLTVDEFVSIWNASPGVTRVRDMTKKRITALRERLSKKAWAAVWRDAIAKFPLKCFSDRDGWRPDVDWFLKPDAVTKILEGKYDWEKKPDGRQPAKTSESAKPNKSGEHTVEIGW